jgi:hypothetical protein
MFELSNNQCCILISNRVVDLGVDKNELLLHKTTQYGDLKQLADAVLKYSPKLVYIIRIAHMEGEEVFGFCKQKVNLALGSKGDSHRHNRVNFFHFCVNHIIAKSSVEIEQPKANEI